MDKAMSSNITRRFSENMTSDEARSPLRETPTVFVARSALSSACLVLGLLANGLVLVALYRMRGRFKPWYVLLLNLCLGDFFQCAVIWPFYSVTSFVRSSVHSHRTCVAGAFVTQALLVQTSWALTALIADRTLSITRPMYYLVWPSKRKYTTAAAICWLYALVVSAPPIFGFGRYVYDADTFGCFTDFKQWHYSVVFMGSSVTIPCFVVIIACYVLIYMNGKSSEIGAQASVANSKPHRDARLSLVLLAMFLVFAISWLPFILSRVIEAFLSDSTPVRHVKVWSLVFITLGSCADPIMYGINNNTIKREVMKLLGRE